MLAIPFASCTDANTLLVADKAELEEAIKLAAPGQEIVLKNGIWKDTEINFKGEGTEESPIVLRAQEAGKVFLEGASNISLSGKYLEVKDLVFRNGYTPSGAVIEFKTGKKELAYHSRVTNCVVDHFSNPERYETDYWVAIYGKHNRFDHNSLIGKGNRGVTLAVRLNTEESRDNHHIIENNYFGGRQNLASNGGETLRIGTSHYSRTYSNTIVRNNYFEECDGELEIISNKSCGNVFSNNVFYRSKGTLTMRHGHHTTVENNYFIGDRKANTGGIRVINENQTVKNNYLYGLTGHRFRGALVVMNGVPNSPINRYNQVIDSNIEGNLLIDCDHVQLCAGSDEERSAIPQNTVFAKNLFLSNTTDRLFTVYDDISGIQFEGNWVNQDNNVPQEAGFGYVAYTDADEQHELKLPSEEVMQKAGLTHEFNLPISKTETGATYYDNKVRKKLLSTGQHIEVKPGKNTLVDALKEAQAGDVLLLEEGGEYSMTKDLVIKQPITIKGVEEAKAKIFSSKNSFFKIENGGALALENLIIDGAESPDQAGNAVVSTSKYSMNSNYKLFVKNCDIVDLTKNHSFSFMRSYKSTVADTISVVGSTFSDITGHVFELANETDDMGMYNVENFILSNNSFENIGGALAHIYRGGTDESTFGPHVQIKDCTVKNTGHDKRNKTKSVLSFHGVQKLDIDGVVFEDSQAVQLHLTNGEPISTIRNTTFKATKGIVANRKDYTEASNKYLK